MNRLLHDSIRLALVVLLPLLIAVAPAMAQTIVYQGDTTKLAVNQMPGDTYEWELYNVGSVNFATTPGNCPGTSADFVGGNTGPIINVNWLKTGTYFFKVTAIDAANCTNNLKIGMVTVKAARPTARIMPPTAICTGVTDSLSVVLTGIAPWDVTFTDGTKIWTVPGISTTTYVLIVSPKTTTNYWITQVKDKNELNVEATEPVKLQVNPKPKSSKIYLYQP